jgi:hypothetical protein
MDHPGALAALFYASIAQCRGIYFDDLPSFEYEQESLHSRLGYGSQSPLLLAGTVWTIITPAIRKRCWIRWSRLPKQRLLPHAGGKEQAGRR